MRWCPSISAASILAKVHRDRWCAEFHLEYPQYGFADHKGYSTAEHLAALREHGACPQHRRSFAPVAEVLAVSSEGSAAVTHVTSRDNPLIKDLRKLSQDSTAYRKQGRVWLEGDHLCRAALARGLKPALAVFLSPFGL
jgi:hypothetical protein